MIDPFRYSKYLCVTEDIVEGQGNKKKMWNTSQLTHLLACCGTSIGKLKGKLLPWTGTYNFCTMCFQANMPGKLAYQWSYTMQASYRSNWFPIIDGQPPVWVVYTLKCDSISISPPTRWRKSTRGLLTLQGLELRWIHKGSLSICEHPKCLDSHIRVNVTFSVIAH